jgi:hypothetical protein
MSLRKILTRLNSGHEFVRHANGQIEILQAAVFFRVNERLYVRMVDSQDPHVRPTSAAAQLNVLRSAIVDAHERHRSGRCASRRGNDIPSRAQARERESRSSSRSLNQGGVCERAEYRLHVVIDGKYKARRELA